MHQRLYDNNLNEVIVTDLKMSIQNDTNVNFINPVTRRIIIYFKTKEIEWIKNWFDESFGGLSSPLKYKRIIYVQYKSNFLQLLGCFLESVTFTGDDEIYNLTEVEMSCDHYEEVPIPLSFIRNNRIDEILK